MKTSILAMVSVLMFQGAAWAAPLRVVTTTEDLAAIAREVGGPSVQAESLAKGSQDPHFLEARPSLILKAARADLFVQAGMELEAGWVGPLLVSARNPAIQPGMPGYLDASQAITPLEVPSGPIDRSEGDVHPSGNPHYWLDPENGKLVASALADRFERLLPEQAAQIETQREDFVKRLDAAIARWKQSMAPYKGAKVVTYHRSWSYFARAFGLDVAGYMEPKPGIPPSPAHLNQLILLMKQQRIGLIIMEPYFSRSAPELLVRETGAQLLVLPPSVGAEGVRTYLELFETLVDQLTTALGKGA
ncbi:MAG: metal ABC transporter substrate-binding protein [Nitrospirota bacterium]